MLARRLDPLRAPSDVGVDDIAPRAQDPLGGLGVVAALVEADSQRGLADRSIKEGVRRLMAHAAIEEAEDLVLMAYESADFKEGIDAFLNKRAPKWTGR